MSHLLLVVQYYIMRPQIAPSPVGIGPLGVLRLKVNGSIPSLQTIFFIKRVTHQIKQNEASPPGFSGRIDDPVSKIMFRS